MVVCCNLLPACGKSDIITGTVCALLCIAYLASWVLLVLAELVVSMFGACVMSVFLLHAFSNSCPLGAATLIVGISPARIAVAHYGFIW